MDRTRFWGLGGTVFFNSILSQTCSSSELILYYPLWRLYEHVNHQVTNPRAVLISFLF